VRLGRRYEYDVEGANRGSFPAQTCTAPQDLRCGEFKVGEHQFVSRAGIRDYEHVPIWNSG